MESDDIIFELISEETVDRLERDERVVLPEKKIDIPEDEKWNEKQMASKLLQGIQNGDSIPKIAGSLESVIGKNAASQIRNARTMCTSAENNGRLDSYRNLADQGVVQKKVWMATPDDRTRPTHIDIDGEEVNIDEPFSNDCMFPGDGNGPAEEVWCCRCSMRDNIIGFMRADGSISYVEHERDESMHDEQIAEEKERRAEERPSKKQEKSESHEIVNGKDISKTWKRRLDQFAFEIEDVINAQGFDGLPRVVDAKEFDRYVQESNFIAQRGYTAPNQETLDSYQAQLYYGKWYVDCSKGGSLNGQGMNAIGNIGTSLSQSSIEFAKEYSAPSSGVGKVETFTVDKSAKIISSSDLGEILWEKLDNAKSKEERNAIEKLSEDQGRFAALLGYDVLQVNQRGSDDKIFIVLNRTKVIFKKG